MRSTVILAVAAAAFTATDALAQTLTYRVTAVVDSVFPPFTDGPIATLSLGDTVIWEFDVDLSVAPFTDTTTRKVWLSNQGVLTRSTLALPGETIQLDASAGSARMEDDFDNGGFFDRFDITLFDPTPGVGNINLNLFEIVDGPAVVSTFLDDNLTLDQPLGFIDFMQGFGPDDITIDAPFDPENPEPPASVRADLVSIEVLVQRAIDGDLRDIPSQPRLLAANTDFGDAVVTSANSADGSEFANIRGCIENGVLKLGIAGNLQTNFNKLNLFFDTRPGGQSKLRGDNPDVDFQGLNRMGDDGSGNGLILGNDKKPFEADFFITYTTGIDGGTGQPAHFLASGQILTEGGGIGGFVGGGLLSAGPIVGIGDFGGTVSIDIDNSNSAGVGTYITGTDECGDPVAALAVNTGIELEYPLTELFWDGEQETIKVIAFLNGVGHDFIANQFTDDIGYCVGAPANLGEPRNANLPEAAAGNQFIAFSVAPDPSLAPAVADLTTTGATQAGQPGFAEPDGNVDLDDLGYFLNFWLLGTP